MFRKFIGRTLVASSLLGTILVVSPVAIAHADQFRRGDYWQTGQVNLIDAISILAYLSISEFDAPDCLDAGDVDDNGAVNLLDVIILLGNLFGTSAPPIAEPLDCGDDPTPDTLTCVDYNGCP